jgi:ATP-binding cassette subfamily B protein
MEADRILVMDGGRIVQQGNHASLLGQQGLYRRIWNLQSSLEAQMREAGDVSA